MYGGPLGALMRQIVRLPIIWDGRTDGGGFSMSLLLPPDAALAFSAYAARARAAKKAVQMQNIGTRRHMFA